MAVGNEVKDLYDSERRALHGIKIALSAKHSFKGVTTVDQEDAVKRVFAREAANRCAEIGLIIDVLWEWETLQCLVCSFKSNRAVTFDGGAPCPGCGSSEGQRKAGSPDCSSNPDDQNLYWNPRLVVLGRTEKLPEFDHEKLRFEITSGLLDGKPGYIREDGTKTEDPIRKNIL